MTSLLEGTGYVTGKVARYVMQMYPPPPGSCGDPERSHLDEGVSKTTLGALHVFSTQSQRMEGGDTENSEAEALPGNGTEEEVIQSSSNWAV
jgi:hypothetical protein